MNQNGGQQESSRRQELESFEGIGRPTRQQTVHGLPSARSYLRQHYDLVFCVHSVQWETVSNRIHARLLQFWRGLSSNLCYYVTTRHIVSHQSGRVSLLLRTSHESVFVFSRSFRYYQLNRALWSLLSAIVFLCS